MFLCSVRMRTGSGEHQLSVYEQKTDIEGCAEAKALCVLAQLAASEKGALGYKLLVGLALGALGIFYACLWMYYQYHLCASLTLFSACFEVNQWTHAYAVNFSVAYGRSRNLALLVSPAWCRTKQCYDFRFTAICLDCRGFRTRGDVRRLRHSKASRLLEVLGLQKAKAY